MAELTITPNRRNKYTNKVPDKISYMKSEARERRLSLLHLIHSFLLDQKLYVTTDAFEKECQLTGHYQLCENIDLEIIFQEFQSYYFTKFQKYPKILKYKPEEVKKTTEKKHSAKVRAPTPAAEKNNSSDNDDFHFEIVSYPSSLTDEKPKAISEKVICDIGDFSGEWKELANTIMQECFIKNAQQRWSDCIGVESSIEKLKEAIVYPVSYPSLFKNVNIWKGVLLFGPPGTGKTLLAKALTSERTTFITVSSSIFTSKWRGESEKMIKVLFDLAKYFAPTTIFIDEIDALVFSTDHQHDASKRFRSEFLTQVDGILSNSENIFLLGCTNLPWNLDGSILRRFEKRLFIGLPNKDSRRELLRHYLPTTNNLRDQDFEYFATVTENYSGADIKNVCKEAVMCCVREKIAELKTNKHPEELRNVTYRDVEQAVANTKPSISFEETKKYFVWNDKHASY